MYGTETGIPATLVRILFENDVKMYGTETLLLRIRRTYAFENDVKMYGTETRAYHMLSKTRLRMM